MNKSYVLKKSYDIEKLLQNKMSVGSKYYVIYYKNNVNNEVHIAISASKKIGNAVKRNYQKRMIREILRKKIKKIENLDILFVIKTNSLNLTFQEKEQQINYLLKKIKTKGENKNEKL